MTITLYVLEKDNKSSSIRMYSDEVLNMSKKYTNKYTKKSNINSDSVNLDTANYLIIVESPSKCAKIESYLGLNYCCIASKGHFRGIDGLRAIDTKITFEPKFTEIPEKKDHISFMRRTISKFSKDKIILATDDDREGEAIAWHICDLFGLPVETTPRIIFHEVTKSALQNAIKSPTIINLKLVKAQHARQVLDIIVGYKVSPMLWKYLYNNNSNSLSAGRCQTPALRLVYDNHMEKMNKGNLDAYYKTTGTFFDRELKFELDTEFKTRTEIIHYLKQSIRFNHILSIHKTRETEKSPPKPFHTSRLLQVASNILHISPNETMRLCQQLYQNGYITYMRTESTKYAKPFLKEIDNFITSEYGNEKYVGKLSELENKETNNPHEAIRVTQLINRTISSEEPRLVSMYNLIWKNTVESCMSSALYNSIPIEISGPENTKYKYTHEIPLFMGWKIVNEKKMNTEVQNEANGLYYFFQTYDNREVNRSMIESNVYMKNRHSHYTEAGLINKLEEMGIGRPSTFSSIVSTIQERGYVKRTDIEGVEVDCNNFTLKNYTICDFHETKTFGNEKNKLSIQPIGQLTIEFLANHYNSLFSYEYSKDMEDRLDNIANADDDWSSICRDCSHEIKCLTDKLGKVHKQVYDLDEEHVLLFEKYGPVIQKRDGDNKPEYISVKKTIKIDMEKLKNGKYTLDDLVEIQERNIGSYNDIPVIIKNGKYGIYLQYGDMTESLKDLGKDISDIILDDVLSMLDKPAKDTLPEKNVLRTVTSDISVRKGKFGAYVYYKTPQMKTPKFLNIKKFKGGYLMCDKEILITWLKETYKISDM